MPFVEVQDYEEYKNFVKQSEGKKFVAYFNASEDPETGKTWCPDCALADPTVLQILKKSDEKHVVCNVGVKKSWRDPVNPFRQDELLQLTSIPTLFNCASGKRIVDEKELAKPEVVINFLKELT